ncbi:MAG TPA: HlyD family efflux transporter periplasmic adaptor subunit [Oculatellaceae cyanobacterium]
MKILVLALLAVCVTAGGGYFVWQNTHHADTTPKLMVSGRIEGYETNVGAKIGGRIESIGVREGDFVKVGQPIVNLSDADIQAQLRGAKAQLNKAKEQRAQSLQQISVIENQTAQAKLLASQANEDAQGRIRQAEAQVSASTAALAQAQAQLNEAMADVKLATLRDQRYRELAKDGAVQQDQADQAATTLATTTANLSSRQAAVESARKNLSAAEGNLEQAKSTRLNPYIRQLDLLSTQRQLLQAKSQLSAANEDVANAQSAIEQIQANIAYMNIDSPIDGVVTARAVEPGAVVVPGQTVLSLINLQTVYLRGFVPDAQIGTVYVGQKAEVFLDSAPKTALAGTVIEIDPKASFTPENIYFKEDRVKQVFGIKIAITDPHGLPKPGMPADGEILLAKKQ